LTLPAEPARTVRPWGWYETVAEGTGYRVKRLLISRGRRISLQRHHHRCEHWVVVAGQGVLTLDDQQLDLSPGSQWMIPMGAVHRAEARQLDLEIIEVQRGDWLSEDDIERLADDFGRCTKQ
jgi:mannose-6-phosphate isomerase-like protein (cupin superfamily)